jgi:hypothetical protein
VIRMCHLVCIKNLIFKLYAEGSGNLAIDGNRDYLGKVFSLADINVKAEMLSYFIWDFIKM